MATKILENKRVVILTDCTDVAYSEMRGLLLSNFKQNNVDIEPLVEIKPFSIVNGEFLLRLVADAYPSNTNFLIVCNPLPIRTERLVGKTKEKNLTFVGANTGILGWLAKDFGIKELYEIKDPGFFPFGGKYVHTPAMASIINGKKLSEFGKKFSTNDIRNSNIIEGTVLHIDNFGLIKIFGKIPKNLSIKDSVTVTVNGVKRIKAIFDTRMMNNPDNTWVYYPGSSLGGLPELGKVRANGAKELEVKEGDIISISYK